MRADLEIPSQEQYHKRMIREVLSEKHYFRNALEREYRETTQGKGA